MTCYSMVMVFLLTAKEMIYKFLSFLTCSCYTVVHPLLFIWSDLVQVFYNFSYLCAWISLCRYIRSLLRNDYKTVFFLSIMWRSFTKFIEWSTVHELDWFSHLLVLRYRSSEVNYFLFERNNTKIENVEYRDFIIKRVGW